MRRVKTHTFIDSCQFKTTFPNLNRKRYLSANCSLINSHLAGKTYGLLIDSNLLTDVLSQHVGSICQSALTFRSGHLNRSDTPMDSYLTGKLNSNSREGWHTHTHEKGKRHISTVHMHNFIFTFNFSWNTAHTSSSSCLAETVANKSLHIYHGPSIV